MAAHRAAICNHSWIGRIGRTTKLLAAFLVVLGVLPAVAAASNTLGTYGTLSAGQSIVSPDGHYELVMQSDGNLVEYIVGGRAIWASHTNGDSGSHAVMQAGGNLAVYNPAGAAVWSSNSRGTGCPQLVIQNDGNVVIYSPKAIWATHTVQTTMEPGDVLHPGWSIYSPSEQLQLIMQADGNLVLYDGAGKPLWASNTDHHPGAYAVMQSDGNFVVYPPTGHALWASGTDHHSGAYLSLQSDGNLVVYEGSTALWATKTNGKASGGSLGPAPPAAVSVCPAPAPPPPPDPVVTTPVTTPVPVPVVPHALAVRLKISWTWNHAVTHLHAAKIGSFPGRSQIFVQCRGKGCPRKRDISARGARNVRRLLRRLHGRRYRAGDRVLIVLKAPGYLPERAMVKILNGRLPLITLLSS
ncbi:MAG TPA: hypothetical protein VMA77_33020 [Solirubrobacteraceae bacterium]|nr:hypothetical protein [Solirubrobacteraceae bacterium]